MNSFWKACKWLENESNVHSMKEFQIKVQEYLGEGYAYTLKYLKQLLINHYGSHVMFSNEKGKQNLIYLVDMAKYIIERGKRERSMNTDT